MLFVERDKYDGNGNENWYSKIFINRECLKYKDYAYSTESINLGSLDDNSIKELLDNFADRCLFILFTADACLRGKNYSAWNAEKLLSSYITQYISKLPETTQLESHLNLLAIATATGGVNIETDAGIPVLSTYIENFINDFDYKNNIRRGQAFIRCLCEKEESDSIITPMYPDLVGEYFFISRINNILESFAKDWVSIFLNEKYKEYCITFLARSLEDWDLQGKLNDVKDWFLERLQSNPDDKLYSAYFLSTLASIYNSKGNYRMVVEYEEKSKDIYEEVLPENHPDLAVSYNNLGNAYDDKGALDKAIELYQRALAIFKIALPNTHQYTKGTYENIIKTFLEKGDDENAQKYYDEMINFCK